MKDYEFTNEWNKDVPSLWEGYLKEWIPNKLLEVGSYEGSTTCFLIDNVPTLTEIFCVDTWEGGIEHVTIGEDMSAVESRFDRNLNIALASRENVPDLYKLKGMSYKVLSSLMAEHEGTFDWIYIDGSHMAADVLTDATLCLNLLRPGGVIVFDDYLWEQIPTGKFDNTSPKMAIDAFIECNRNINLDVLYSGYQVIIKKKV